MPNPIKSFLGACAFHLYNRCVTRFPSYSVRHAYLRGILGVRIGPGAAVHMGCFFTGRHISIGRNSVINRNCYLDGRGSLAIGDNVSISPECYLLTLGHDPRDPGFAAKPGPVVIGNRAWLGARTMVLPGVTLGEGAAIGAGAVVAKSQEPFAIAAGVPARKIGERPRGLGYELRYFPWFDTDITG